MSESPLASWFFSTIITAALKEWLRKRITTFQVPHEKSRQQRQKKQHAAPHEGPGHQGQIRSAGQLAPFWARHPGGPWAARRQCLPPLAHAEGRFLRPAGG